MFQRGLIPLVLAACSLSMACTGSTITDEALAKRARAPERLDPAPVIAVREVRFDGTLTGYVKVKLVERRKGKMKAHVVYDDYFQEVGFLTEAGRTFRISGAEVVDLGHRSHKDGLRLLLHGESVESVTLVPMPRPRTLESEAKEAAEAAAQPSG
ncbi:hypothetical protein ACFL59_05380 [Planctomycetota bacterium]